MLGLVAIWGDSYDFGLIFAKLTSIRYSMCHGGHFADLNCQIVQPISSKIASTGLMRFGLTDLLDMAFLGLIWLQESESENPEPPPPAVPESTPAVGPGQPGAPPAEDPGFLVQFLTDPINLLLISGFLFVFLVLRPQQKQMKALQQSLAGLKKNDKIVTNSGIHGVVVQANPEDQVVTIRIDENSGARMTINREAISRIVDEKEK